MDGEDRDGVGVRIHLGRGRVVARVDKRLQVAGHEDDSIVRKQVRLRADDVEESGDVRKGLFGGHGVRRRQPAQQTALAQELIEQLAGRPLVGQLHVAANVRNQPLQDCPRFRGNP